MSKILKPGTYVFKENCDFSAVKGESPVQYTSGQITGYDYQGHIIALSPEFGDSMGSNIYEGYLVSNYQYNFYNGTRWGYRTVYPGQQPIEHFPDDTTNMRTLIVNEYSGYQGVTMSDELYAVFQSNIIKETRQLSTPTLSFDNGKLTIGNIDADAIGFKIYRKTGSAPTSYTLIKTVTFSEISGVNMYFVDDITTPNHAYEFVVTVYSNDEYLEESQFSNPVYFNRNLDFTLTYKLYCDNIQSHSWIGTSEVRASLLVNERNYGYYNNSITEHTYTIQKLIPIYDDYSASHIVSLRSTQKPNYKVFDIDLPTSQDFSITVESGKNAEIVYSINTTQPVNPYHIYVNYKDNRIIDYDTMYPCDGIEIENQGGLYSRIIFYGERIVQSYDFSIDTNETLLGLSTSTTTLEPEYPIGYSDITPAITTSTTFYVITSTNFEGGIDINLYNNSSESNRVDKSSYLESVGTINGVLRDECNIIDPVINLELHNPPVFNYIYIPSFNRYYFVKEFDFVRTGLYRLKLHVDVLMSYKDAIKNLECLVTRNEHRFNKYISSRLPTKNNIEIKEYVVALPTKTQGIILTKLSDTEWGNDDTYGIPCVSLQLVTSH